MELPDQEDSSKHKGVGKDCGQCDDGKDHSKTNLEGLEGLWVPTFRRFCSIHRSVEGLLEKAFH